MSPTEVGSEWTKTGSRPPCRSEQRAKAHPDNGRAVNHAPIGCGSPTNLGARLCLPPREPPQSGLAPLAERSSHRMKGATTVDLDDVAHAGVGEVAAGDKCVLFLGPVEDL